MASDDFFQFDFDKMNLNQLIAVLNKMDSELTDTIMPEIMNDVGNELLSEEKRILAGSKYTNFSNMLSIQQKKDGGKWRVKAGYNTAVITSRIEVLIIEFGRPGHSKNSVKKHGVDKKGRKIGVIQPYPHIRAALFNKKEQLYKIAEKKFKEKIEEIWQEN